VSFDMQRFKQGVAALNGGCTCFEMSCRTGEGVDAWVDWVLQQRLGVPVP
jgi:hydrogenase nickel incorporation protein HypB